MPAGFDKRFYAALSQFIEVIGKPVNATQRFRMIRRTDQQQVCVQKNRKNANPNFPNFRRYALLPPAIW